MNESSEETQRVNTNIMQNYTGQDSYLMSEDDTEIEHDIDLEDLPVQEEDITNEPSGELLRDIIADFVCNL